MEHYITHINKLRNVQRFIEQCPHTNHKCSKINKTMSTNKVRHVPISTTQMLKYELKNVQRQIGSIPKMNNAQTQNVQHYIETCPEFKWTLPCIEKCLQISEHLKI
jgi:hypothetical protein